MVWHFKRKNMQQMQLLEFVFSVFTVKQKGIPGYLRSTVIYIVIII